MSCRSPSDLAAAYNVQEETNAPEGFAPLHLLRMTFKRTGAHVPSPEDGMSLQELLDRLGQSPSGPAEVAWRFETGDWVCPSPAVADGVAYFGSYDGNCYALDATSGAEKRRSEAGDWADSPPAVADGVVYLGSEDGYLYAVE